MLLVQHPAHPVSDLWSDGERDRRLHESAEFQRSGGMKPSPYLWGPDPSVKSSPGLSQHHPSWLSPTDLSFVVCQLFYQTRLSVVWTKLYLWSVNCLTIWVVQQTNMPISGSRKTSSPLVQNMECLEAAIRKFVHDPQVMWRQWGQRSSERVLLNISRTIADLKRPDADLAIGQLTQLIAKRLQQSVWCDPVCFPNGNHPLNGSIQVQLIRCNQVPLHGLGCQVASQVPFRWIQSAHTSVSCWKSTGVSDEVEEAHILKGQVGPSAVHGEHFAKPVLHCVLTAPSLLFLLFGSCQHRQAYPSLLGLLNQFPNGIHINLDLSPPCWRLVSSQNKLFLAVTCAISPFPRWNVATLKVWRVPHNIHDKGIQVLSQELRYTTLKVANDLKRIGWKLPLPFGPSQPLGTAQELDQIDQWAVTEVTHVFHLTPSWFQCPNDLAMASSQVQVAHSIRTQLQGSILGQGNMPSSCCIQTADGMQGQFLKPLQCKWNLGLSARSFPYAEEAVNESFSSASRCLERFTPDIVLSIALFKKKTTVCCQLSTCQISNLGLGLKRMWHHKSCPVCKSSWRPGVQATVPQVTPRDCFLNHRLQVLRPLAQLATVQGIKYPVCVPEQFLRLTLVDYARWKQIGHLFHVVCLHIGG